MTKTFAYDLTDMMTDCTALLKACTEFKKDDSEEFSKEMDVIEQVIAKVSWRIFEIKSEYGCKEVEYPIVDEDVDLRNAQIRLERIRKSIEHGPSMPSDGLVEAEAIRAEPIDEQSIPNFGVF